MNQWEALQTEIVIGAQICNSPDSARSAPTSAKPQGICSTPPRHRPGHTLCPQVYRPQETYARRLSHRCDPGRHRGRSRRRNFNMEMSLADQDRAITILPAEGLPLRRPRLPIPLCLLRSPTALAARRPCAPGRRSGKARKPRVDCRDRAQRRPRRVLSRPGLEPAQRRPGRHRRRPVAVMNDVAYRILGLPQRRPTSGGPSPACFRASRKSRASSPARSSCRTCRTAPSCG